MFLLLLSLACRTKDVAVDTGTLVSDQDSDGIPDDEDCAPDNAEIFPGAEEICDGVDNNCDGVIDTDATDATTWYEDKDSDGAGLDGTELTSCESPGALYAAAGGDCDDLDPESFPGAPERCDDVDNDCDGVVDNDLNTLWYADVDADGFGDASSTLDECDPGAGWVVDDTDCDDLNASTYPDAEEVCDEADNNCDGVVDEGVTEVFYADSDGDGWGGESTLEACEPPVGYEDRSGDCDDTDASISPDGTEICDGLDNDCDGTVDNDDAVDADDFYLDADSDGYGDPALSTAACDAPSGYVDNARDCDDADVAINPAALEVCDSADNDCNGYIDDDDPGLTDGSTFYLDFDSDGYGGSSFTTSACSAPSGYVADSSDCDDSEASTNPGADEYCNTVDDNCDGAIDEDTALDASTWYADADSDTYGDASVSDVECDQPTGYVADDTDCDDTDDTVYPGARERLDSLDNDCDGTVDDNTWVGSGGDGALSVTGSTNLNSDASGTRSYADAVAYGVDSISAAVLTLDATADGIVAGDELLIINLHGSDSAYTNVGNYEFIEVASVSGADVTLSSTPSVTFGESSNADLTDQTVIAQRVPQYTDVDLSSAGTLSVDYWDGSTGGVLAFRATGTVTIASGGVIEASELGYEGGATGTSSNCDAFQGESYAGEGDGDGDGVCTAYNESYGHWINNYGGGGAHITGGGGEYAGGATDGDSWTGGSATAPYAGDTYGSTDLSSLFFGSGGGGVWKGSSNPGPGGDGAGIVFIAAFEIDAQGADGITAVGGTTPYWSTGSWTYGAGGGAGGSVWLIADVLALASGAVSAEGGLGEATHIRIGGDGGEGRIRLDYNELNAETQGTSGASTEEALVAEPDPGYSATP